MFYNFARVAIGHCAIDRPPYDNNFLA